MVLGRGKDKAWKFSEVRKTLIWLGSQEARRRSAKSVYVGSNPTLTSSGSPFNKSDNRASAFYYFI